ncbi:hypothetical protein ACVINW_004103 [Bradyrhizobium sp. USDA 4461]
MAQFGVIAAAGPQQVGSLIKRISDPAILIPDAVRAPLNILADQLVALTAQSNALEPVRLIEPKITALKEQPVQPKQNSNP